VLFSQQYLQSVNGTVTDKESGQPMVGVNVVLVNSSPPLGVQTAADGRFSIKDLKPGRYTLKFSFLGYDDAFAKEILLSSGKQVQLTIELTENVKQLGAIEVLGKQDRSKANNEFASVSARSFSMEENKRFAGTLGDPSRMAQSFAGVVSASDDNNAIVVRGNSPRGLLWRLEGVEIPNPNHFAGSEGSSGGGVAMLSANTLGNTDFFSGAFPAEYGNALSGVFDLSFRKGNVDRREFTFQLGVLGTEAMIEGPFSKKYNGSYLVNYRYSTLQILDLVGFKVAGDVTPKYQDLSFNFVFPSKKIGRFTLFGLGGLSSLGETVKKDTALWKSVSDKTSYTQRQMYGTSGVTHTFLFGDGKTYIKSVASVSYTNNSSGNDTVDNEFTPYTIAQEQYRYLTFRLSSFINRKVDNRNVVRAGAIYSFIGYNLFNDSWKEQEQVKERIADQQGSTHQLQAYWQWKHRFSPVLSVNSGMHLTYFFMNKKIAIEPRVSLEWKVKPAHTLSAAVGLHNRIEAISTYVSNVATSGGITQANKGLPLSRAVHTVAGYNFSFLRDFKLHSEVYFQYLFDVPVATEAGSTFSILNQYDGFVNYQLQNKGRGINYGLEITLEKFFSKNYFFMLTASVFDSKYRAQNGQWYNTAYNANYVMNALGGKEFIVGKKRINIIGITAKVLWRGGTRITPVLLNESIAANTTVVDNTRAYSERLPDYFRIDFGAYFRRNKKRWSWVLSFDAQNVINRQNVAYKVFDPATASIVVKRNLGIIPVISWKVDFGIKR
jgi:hypothetical protein